MKIENPPVNAICEDLIDDMTDILNKVEQERPRILIIKGEGKAFVGGADISEMKDMSPKEAYEFSRRGQELFERIRNLPFPVIAAVNGYAFGGGLELAMSCDLIIASKDVKLGQPEVGLGVIPGFGGTQRLSRMIGPNLAKELIFTGKRITAEEAMRIGLVNQVVDGEDLLRSCKEIANNIIGNAPLALLHAKRAVNEGMDKDISEGLKIEAKYFKKCFETEDQDEGMDAFLNKRKPEFKGK